MNRLLLNGIYRSGVITRARQDISHIALFEKSLSEHVKLKPGLTVLTYALLFKDI